MLYTIMYDIPEALGAPLAAGGCAVDELATGG